MRLDSGRDLVSVSTAPLVHFTDNHFRVIACIDWQGRQADFSIPPLIALPDTALHAQRRKRWNRAFSTAALKEYEEIIAMRASDLLELLSAKTEKDVVDLNKCFGWFR